MPIKQLSLLPVLGVLLFASESSAKDWTKGASALSITLIEMKDSDDQYNAFTGYQFDYTYQLNSGFNFGAGYQDLESGSGSVAGRTATYAKLGWLGEVTRRGSILYYFDAGMANQKFDGATSDSTTPFYRAGLLLPVHDLVIFDIHGEHYEDQFGQGEANALGVKLGFNIGNGIKLELNAKDTSNDEDVYSIGVNFRF